VIDGVVAETTRVLVVESEDDPQAVMVKTSATMRLRAGVMMLLLWLSHRFQYALHWLPTS
jgi:hypothetical protein